MIVKRVPKRAGCLVADKVAHFQNFFLCSMLEMAQFKFTASCELFDSQKSAIKLHVQWLAKWPKLKFFWFAMI